MTPSPSPDTTTTATNNTESVKVAALKAPYDPRLELNVHLNLLQSAHTSNDRRLVSRVLHHLPQLRKQLSAKLLLELLNSPSIKESVKLTQGMEAGLEECGLIEEREAAMIVGSFDAHSSESMIVVEAEAEGEVKSETSKLNNLILGEGIVLAEKTCYALLLLSIYFLDKNLLACGVETASIGILRSQDSNLRTLDPILARLYYYLARFYELSGDLSTVHNFLMTGLRTATLRHDPETQSVIYNSILRLHVLDNSFDAAEKFLEKSPFPEEQASNNQLARFLYYRARVRAVQLKYAEAEDDLNQVIRKAPQGKAVQGFLQSATKFSVVVRLLLGHIPERSIFRSSSPTSPLQAYFYLSQSVRLGDLNQFQQVFKNFETTWTKDGTLGLIQRLHQNVLRIGLRRLSTSYLRISFADIKTKLGLASDQDAEYLVIKAIREGVIDASVNHDQQFLQSRAVKDLYSTAAPQSAFNTRTQYVQTLHNDAVKAMRFPEKAKKKGVALLNGEEAKPTEAELMEEFMNNDDMMDF